MRAVVEDTLSVDATARRPAPVVDWNLLVTSMEHVRATFAACLRATGGLADTVANYDKRTGAGTGFVSYDLRPNSLADTTRMGCLDVAQPPPARRRHASPGDGGGPLRWL